MKIQGNTVGTPMPVADWNQTNPRKADYIKNKPDVCLKNPKYTATPTTLAKVISSAEAGATIQLSAGEYGRLDLIGVDAYPEGLTIVGGEGVTMAGVSITSGVDSIVAYGGSADIASFILPKGLTFRDLTLSDNFSLRNGVVDNLSVIDCHFTKGVINVTPNEFKDDYGYDMPSSTNNPHHYDYTGLKMHDIVVKGCTFDDATMTKYSTAICILSVENIEISDNYVAKASWNGIQINSSNGQYNSGKIRIFNNRITNTRDYAININCLENAELYVIGNRMANANMGLSGTPNSDVIIASNLRNTTTQWSLSGNQGANYNASYSAYIDTMVGIIVTNVVNDRLLAQGESGGWTWKKWENGEAECYGRFSIRGVVRDWIMELVTLPFDFIDINNTHIMASISSTDCMEAVLIMASPYNTHGFNDNTANAITVEITGAVSTTNTDSFTIALQVKGRWK